MKDVTYGQVTISDAWSSTIVLPIEEAALLAKLVAKGRLWVASGYATDDRSDEYRSGLSPIAATGRPPSLPSIEVLDQAEYDRRLTHGGLVMDKRRRELAAEEEKQRREQEAKAQA